MITIPRNHSRKIEAIKNTIVLTTSHRLDNNFEATPVDQAYAWMSLFEYKGKLTDDGDGRYTIHIHSNFWYRLYTADRVEADRKATEARAAELRQRAATTPPLPQGPTREQRQARILARTVSIHDLGKAAPTPAVTVTRTRMAIGTQLAEACAALGIELGHANGYKGTQVYVINGRDYTAGQLADLVLIGGLDAAFGGYETRPVEVAPAELLPESAVTVITVPMTGQWYLIPTEGARLSDRHEFLGPYTTEDMAEHMRETYAREGIQGTVIRSATPPVPRVALAQAWEDAHAVQRSRAGIDRKREMRWKRVPESSPLHPSEVKAREILSVMPTEKLREFLCLPGWVAPTDEAELKTQRWIIQALEDRFDRAAMAAADVVIAGREAHRAAGLKADPALFAVDYAEEILTRIPFLTRRQHDERDGYGCLTAEDSGLPSAMDRDEPGRCERCFCGRLWTLRMSYGFLVWTPTTMFGRTP